MISRTITGAIPEASTGTDPLGVDCAARSSSDMIFHIVETERGISFCVCRRWISSTR